MAFFFVLGLSLFVVAGWAVTAQSTVYELGARPGLFVSAFDLWYALAPGSLILTQIRLESFAPWLWDPVVRTLLWAPAWALAGVPGAALVWFFRPRHLLQPEDQGEATRIAEAANLYDQLAKSAREENLPDPAFDGDRHDELAKAARDEGLRDRDSGLGNLTDEEARAIIEDERRASNESDAPSPGTEGRRS
ncbi:MAG: hypothetical protein EXQ86_04340 [Rhodospirillales bacterium]|nr:hypothetical protein [Rhodospirillales bacterium]